MHSVNKMRTIATEEVAWSDCVCLLVTFVSYRDTPQDGATLGLFVLLKSSIV